MFPCAETAATGSAELRTRAPASKDGPGLPATSAGRERDVGNGCFDPTFKKVQST
jgi:hypothetical protein